MLFKIEVDIDETLSGFDLGDMSFIGNQGAASSKNRLPDQSMMVFIAIVGLLDGLSRFIKMNKKSYEFNGADSSFKLEFERQSDSKILITENKNKIALTESVNILETILKGTTVFLNETIPLLDPEDSVLKDLTSSYNDFCIFCKEEYGLEIDNTFPLRK